MSKMSVLVDTIKGMWAARITNVVVGSRASETKKPGTGSVFADGYRTGYWDGVNDAVNAAAQTDASNTNLM